MEHLLGDPARQESGYERFGSFVFRALQAKQWSLWSEMTIGDGLVAQVLLQTFQDFKPRKIDCGFLILQGCLNDILGVNGGSDYKIRHMGKQVLLRQFGLDIYQEPLRQQMRLCRLCKCSVGMVAQLAILGTMIRMLALSTAPWNR